MAELEYIPQGYKKSPLGIIPLEWDVVHLGSLVSITSGESPSSYCLKNFGKYPYVKVEDMNNCEKYQKNSREYSDDERNIVSINSVIFPKRGAAISNNKVRIAACNLQMDSNMMAITPNANTICEFLYYMIKFKQLYRIADTSTIPQINNKHIIPYKICLPPIEEQKKIAELLNEWDKAIQLQTNLIEKLELRKRALMQRLLTGRVRLNGFSDKWKNVSLGGVLTTLTNGFIYNDNGNGEMPISRIETISTGSINYNKVGYVKYSEQIETYRLNTGDILYSHINSLSHIGKVAYYDGKQPLYHGMNLLRIVVDEKKCSQKYLYYYLTSKRARHKALTIAKPAINQASISISDLSAIKLILPNVSEQTAIAEVLMSADKEIEIAKTKLSSLRNQKRGLMQQLLTGKKRVK